MVAIKRVLLIAATIIAGAGLLDGAFGDGFDWDDVAMFGAIIALQLAVLVGSRGRVTVTLRPDLASWVDRRSARTGEPVNEILDRAVSWLQHGLYEPGNHDLSRPQNQARAGREGGAEAGP